MSSEKENNNHNLRTVEEIDEERDSIPDDEDEKSVHRKAGITLSPEFRRSMSATSSKPDDPESVEQRHRQRHLSISNADLEESHRLDTEKENDHRGVRYTRHSSFDLARHGNPLATKLPPHTAPDEAIEKYYERNNYTVTGHDRSQDFYNKLPSRLQPKHMNLDASSRLSTPGALGEPVTPITRRFDKSIYWFAFHRKQIGFRHILTVLLVLLYTLLGAAIFYTIESSHEKEETVRHVERLEELLTTLAVNMTDNVNDPATSTTIAEMKLYIRDAYIDLMKLEDQYKGSTYYKLEDPENNWKWSFKSAIFFSMNVYTTTGYGSIATDSDIGKILTVIYGLIFVPVTLAALRDLGQFCLVTLTWCYAHILQKFRELTGNKTVDHDEMISIPISACLAILAMYLSFCTLFIYIYDDLSGSLPGSGITMFLSFYFSFISLSTIGLGDVMPNNAPFSPIISILFFFGMCLTKVVNRTTYIAVENGIFGTYTMLENWLDSIVSRAKTADIEQKAAVDAVSSSPEEATTNEMLNNFTVRSIATFMKSNADIYGGGFGRVQIRRGDLINNGGQTNQNTINSISQLRQRATSQANRDKDTISNKL